MEPNDDLYIIVPKWERFQHYKDRNPPWIKVYTNLLHDAAYLRLSLAARGLLQMIWLQYAAESVTLRCGDVRALVGSNRGIGLQLISLRDAGFIELSASKLLAASTETETEIEVDAPLPPTEWGEEKLTPRARGTNPRAIEQNDRAERHRRMVDAAHAQVQTWEQFGITQTDAMHEALDAIEGIYGAAFDDQERQEIIDGALAFSHA